jgi:hypothetical protein
VSVVALLAVMLPGTAAQAVPFTPRSDSEVLQLLPQRPTVGRSAVNSGTSNSDTSAATAAVTVQSLIETARRQGDPRLLGQAEAILSRWPDAGSTPVPLLVLRATVQQSLHQFDQALTTLELALAREPANAQALLTRATILQVRGDYTAASRDCQKLWAAGAPVPAQLCLAGIATATGRANAAESLVLRLLDGVATDDLNTRAWAYSVLADAAERQGNRQAAERYFSAGLATDSGDRYLRAAYADFLLDQQRPEDVLRLTAGADGDDNLLLRRALAWSQLHDGRAAQLVAELRERHDVAARRGERTHLREEARLALWLENKPALALTLAQQNWQQQKESADLRILLESALAARNRSVREQALKWIRNSGFKDARLAALGTT